MIKLVQVSFFKTAILGLIPLQFCLVQVKKNRFLIHRVLITVCLFFFVKVDIFSFAIFVFELLSGSRPFGEYRNIIDIKKAIRRGVRPSLESCDLDTQIPRLEGLMRYGYWSL